MILRYAHLSRHPDVFLAMTSLRVREFDALVADLLSGHAAGGRARRWVAGRSHPWRNRCRRILARWEQQSAHALAFRHRVCALIALRAAGVLG